MSAEGFRGIPVDFVAVDEGEAVWKAFEEIRRQKLEAAKVAALTWLDRGDTAGALVKFVELTMRPVMPDVPTPVLMWTSGNMLLELGKSYAAPIDPALEPFEQAVEASSRREGMRRWIVGYR